MNMRIGLGFDVHRMEAGRPCILGGVAIPHDRGPVGHSDGDPVLHAIADAMLAAAGLGDLGTRFPDDDPAWKGADSFDLLRRTREAVESEGWRVAQYQAIVIAEAPRIAPYRERILARIGEGLPGAAGALSARSMEGLGTVGRGEAIAAQTVVLLERVGS